jgi:hypothetical protein
VSAARSLRLLRPPLTPERVLAMMEAEGGPGLYTLDDARKALDAARLLARGLVGAALDDRPSDRPTEQHNG